MFTIRNLFTQKITITKDNNFTILTIKEECSLQEYTKILKKTKSSYLLDIINLKHLLKNNSISPKKIILYNQNNYLYIISITQNQIYITRRTPNTNIIEETINIDRTEYSYQISQLIHTIDGNSIDIKSHYKDPKKNYSFMHLPKEIALNIARTIIEDLSQIPNISSHLNIREITKILNILLEQDYFPIISNNLLTLSWQNRYGSTNIYEKQRATLDIILNKTKEVIGSISFNTSYNPNNSYTGNISYSIKDEFQNNHYATIALSLLKELLRKHKLQQNKPLYISAEENNIKSQHVAINNGGKLYYEGPIPKSDNLTKFSGITKIKMYKITL